MAHSLFPSQLLEFGVGMVNIGKAQVSWSNFQGAPGTSTFYFLAPATSATVLHQFFIQLSSSLPLGVTCTMPTEGDMIDPLSGELMGAWSTAAQTTAIGTSESGYAAPVGAIVKWGTGTIIDGHRLVGRTFLVPLAGDKFEADGTLVNAAATSIQTIAQNFVDGCAGNLVVWHRPRKATVKHPVDRAGGFSVVTTATVPDRAMVLRSRRS